MRRSTRSTARSEQPVLVTNPQSCGRYPIRRSQAREHQQRLVAGAEPGHQDHGAAIAARNPAARKTGSDQQPASSSAQRVSRRWSPHQRSSGHAGSSSVRKYIGSRRLSCALYVALPSVFGAGFRLPDRSASQASQSPHQLPAAAAPAPRTPPASPADRRRRGSSTGTPPRRARRVHERLDVAAVGQHEAAVAAEQDARRCTRSPTARCGRCARRRSKCRGRRLRGRPARRGPRARRDGRTSCRAPMWTKSRCSPAARRTVSWFQ